MRKTGTIVVLRAGEKARRAQHMTQIDLLAVCAFSLGIYATGAASKEPEPIPPGTDTRRIHRGRLPHHKARRPDR